MVANRLLPREGLSVPRRRPTGGILTSKDGVHVAGQPSGTASHNNSDSLRSERMGPGVVEGAIEAPCESWKPNSPHQLCRLLQASPPLSAV